MFGLSSSCFYASCSSARLLLLLLYIYTFYFFLRLRQLNAICSTHTQKHTLRSSSFCLLLFGVFNNLSTSSVLVFPTTFAHFSSRFSSDYIFLVIFFLLPAFAFVKIITRAFSEHPKFFPGYPDFPLLFHTWLLPARWLSK